MRTILVACSLLVIGALAPEGAAQGRPEPAPAAVEIPRLAPRSKEAKPLTEYQWTAEAGATDEHDGLRFTWSLPEGFRATKSYDLVVICHGTGLDYRWGQANLRVGEFRPGSIVVSVDGTSEGEGGTRLFKDGARDVVDFRDFVLEMARSFPVEHVVLYGHSQGSFFAVHVASAFPGLIEGVVAQGSGVWASTNIAGRIRSVPIAFVHGTADPVVPYGQSVAGRDALVSEGHGMTFVRRLEGYNHWPNGVRVSECVDWCIGMVTSEPGRALGAAESMLAPKGKDGYGFEAPVAYGAALMVLRRVTQECENPCEEPTDEQKARAAELIGRIDAEGAKHVALLREDLKSSGDLLLGLGAEGGAWVGHLLPLREDFRGVPSVEAFVAEIGFDEAVSDQEDAGVRLVDMWNARREEKQKFEGIADSFLGCFMLDTLPAGMAEQMGAWKGRAAELGLSEESLEKYAAMEMWVEARRAGLARYAGIWREWK